MSILAEKNIFTLNTQNYQYVMGVGADNILHHLHWGRQVPSDDFSVYVYKEQNSNHSALDFMNFEYTPFGSTMYRECAFKCVFADGCRDTVLYYDSFVINANTLTVVLKDPHYGLTVELNYTVYSESDVITRNAVIKNTGADDIVIEKACSAEFSFPGRRNYNIYNSNGTWSGENNIRVQKLKCGTIAYESRKGISGHGNSPYFIVGQDECEDSGKIFFAVLEYSGNFKVAVNKDGFGVTRAVIGVNEFDFSYTLKSGCEFVTPNVHFGYAESLGEMSNTLNSFARKNIFPKQFADEVLPVLYNSWEATGFDIDTQGQKKLADKAKQIGAELFVVDDGWFGERKDDYAGLGDWYVDREKFPNDLTELVEYVNSLGMDFGLWLEPEMVNENSDLFRKHPDWTYHYDTRKASELRHQLVLNLTKPKVHEYVFNCFDELLSKYNIKYIKWDMNRPFSEVGAENLENEKMLWFLHVRSVYDVVDRLKGKYPHVQFEACASGGGRADWGSFRHFDQVWTSDNTDALDRIYIQKGFSLINPTKPMRAWVTDTGNASMDFKCKIAMQGALGIGCNLTKISQEDLQTIKENVKLYKKIRKTVQFGDRFRLMDLDRDELSAVQYVSEDKSESVVFTATPGTRFMHNYFNIFLKGLEKDKKYILDFGDKKVIKTGAYLMNVGVEKKYSGKFVSEIWILKRL